MIRRKGSAEDRSVAASSAMGFLKGLLIRLATTAVAFWLATVLIPGITLDSDSATETVTTLVLVAAIFGVVNAVLQPVIKTVGCGFYLLTLGLIALVVNGLLFLLTSWIAGEVGLPFHVDGFWPAAVLGALLVGIVTWILGAILDRD
jgi:putative membrane protein